MKELAWEIAQTTRAIRHFYDERTARLGVTTAQWRAIAWVGHEPGMKQVELADRLDIEPITAGRVIDRLQERGLIERQPDPDDRRVWRLALTERGEPIFERLKNLADRMADRAFVGFSEEELQTMRANLARIRENLSRIDGSQRKSA